MHRIPGRTGILFVLTLLGALWGCASEPVPLVNVAGRGEQWVYPYFLQEQPTVLAFWNTGEMRCFEDVPALIALDAREESVQIVSIATGESREEIDKWIRRHAIPYVVLVDPDEHLAGTLEVDYYPTYIFFDVDGKEVQRVTDVREVRKWYYPRWVERAAYPPES